MIKRATAAAAIGMACLLIFPIFLLSGAPHDTTNPAHQATDTTGLSDAVPAQYRDAVLRAGSICPTITPAVIAAQIQQESNWNPGARSHAGARGISQFMPTTWATKGRDGDGDGHADIDNPTDAIISQGHYNCELATSVASLTAIGLAHGDTLDLTLAAYNAGLGNVHKHKGIPPFAETRTYITRIRAAIPTYEGNTLHPDTPTGDIQAALDWAIGIANDDSHRYVLGAEGPHYDCSGLTQAFMARLGITLPHRANEQAKLGRPVSEADARPGDLIFWSRTPGGHYYHTAIYLGGGRMVSADNPSMGINVEPIYWREQTTFRTYLP